MHLLCSVLHIISIEKQRINMKKMIFRKYCLVTFLAISSMLSKQMLCDAADTIDTSETIRDSSNETLISSGGSFEMGFFSPENSNKRYVGIWYKKISVRSVVWVANRDNPLTDRSGALRIARPGQLLLLNSTNDTIWSTNHTSSTLQNPIAQLLDSGNLVVRDVEDADDPIWQSFDYPTDTIMPGMKLGKSFTTGIQVYITSWKNSGDPAAGDYTLHFDYQGYPQVTIEKGPLVQYKSGPWNGMGFSGLPNLKANTIFSFGVVMSKEGVYYHYEQLNKSVTTRLTISESGIEHRWIWVERTQEWISYLTVPVDNCDVYNGCGPYGSCNTANTPFCGCLNKFEAKDRQGWDGGDYTKGCVRSTPFDCGNGDGFLKYSGIKLPDTQYSWYNETMSLRECELSCSKNCSCTAYSLLNMSSGNGCLLWFGDLLNMREMSPGQDIYIRMPSSDLGKKREILVATLSLAIGILLLSLCVGMFQYFQKRKKQYHQLPKKTGMARFKCNSTNPEESGSNVEIPRFDLFTIVNATDNFSCNNMLGEGGYGAVYKGVLGDGQEIAVKRRSSTSHQGVDEFMNEVRCIAKLQHRNLVKLLGCCIKGEEKMLVYEYMTNKSLDLILFDSRRRVSLDWPKRFTIINSIARGIQYLHEDSLLRVVHRDLKASNILLDSEMIPKVSDFGLARTFGGNQTGDITGRLMGTYGYIAPEYLGFGQFSVKSDVYSFGVLVLEIVSGERNRGNLLGNAWMAYREERLEEIVDPVLERSHIAEMLRSIHVGLLCVQQHPDERPSMSSVVVMLSNGSVLPDPTFPAAFTARQMLPIETSVSSTNTEDEATHPATTFTGEQIPTETSVSTNTITNSLVEGR